MKEIGIILHTLDEEYQEALFHAVNRASLSKNWHLNCVEGENFDRVLENSDNPFPLSSLLPLDGIIILSSIFHDNRMVEGFFQSKELSRKSMVSLGVEVPGIPSVTSNPVKALHLLITHLADEHHYRRFLFVGGAEDNVDNIQRLDILQQRISEYQKKDPSFSLEIRNGGIFSEHMGISVMDHYMGQYAERNIDVIIAASDSLAMGVRKSLISSGNQSWKNCPITGFDDLPSAGSIKPGLTTIHQPLKEMGEAAVSMMENLLSSKDQPLLSCIDAYPVYRESCGCLQTKSRIIETYHPQTECRFHNYDITRLTYLQVNIHSFEELYRAMDEFFRGYRIGKIAMIPFPEPCDGIPEETCLLYQYQPGQNFSDRSFRQQVNIHEYLQEDLMSFMNCDDLPVYFYVLQACQKMVGIICFTVEQEDFLIINHSCLIIANGLHRLQLLEKEHAYTKNLEKLVDERTREWKKEAEQRLKVEAQVLRISELERRRFSMDLHDDICQRLAGIHMIAHNYATKHPMLETIASMSSETLTLTRNYAHDSFPMDLEEAGIVEALENLCHIVNSAENISCFLDIHSQNLIHLSNQSKINIFRIIQEAVNNACKHSRGNKIYIRLYENKQVLSISIKDNGRGGVSLNHQSVGDKRRRPVGLGLRSMEYRANQLNAHFQIDSTKKTGTQIALNIPLTGIIEENENEKDII